MVFVPDEKRSIKLPLPLGKGAKNGKTDLSAFFGVELSAANILFCNGGAYILSVLAGGEQAVLTARGVIGMDEINEIALLKILEYGVSVSDMQCVPADLGDLQLRGEGSLHTDNRAAKQAETLVLSVFVAFLKEHLHTEAYTHKLFALFRFLDNHLIKPALPKLAPCILKCSNAGQKDLIRASYDLGISRYNRLCTYCIKGATKRKQVS